MATSFFEGLLKHIHSDNKTELKERVVDAPIEAKARAAAKAKPKAEPAGANSSAGAAQASGSNNASTLTYANSANFFGNKQLKKETEAVATSKTAHAKTNIDPALQKKLEISTKLERLDQDTQSALKYLISIVDPADLAIAKATKAARSAPKNKVGQIVLNNMGSKKMLIANIIVLHEKLAEVEPKLPANPGNKNVFHPGLEFRIDLNEISKTYGPYLESRSKGVTLAGYGDKLSYIINEVTRLRMAMENIQSSVVTNDNKHSHRPRVTNN